MPENQTFGLHDELAEGWALTTLGNVGKWSTGGTPSRKKSSYFGGGIPWVKSGDLDDGLVAKTEETLSYEGMENSAAKVLPTGSLSVALYGATIGKLGVLGMDAATNQACANCEINEGAALTWFIFYYLLQQRKRLIEAGQGGAQPNLTNQIVREWPVVLPPLAEQQRIVAKVEALLARVNAARQRLAKVPAILKRFRQSVLAAACSGRLTTDWRQDQDKDEDTPSGWEMRSLDSLFEIRTGGTPSRKNAEYFTNGTIPWVKTSEVHNCDIFDTEEKITEEALENSSAKVFPRSTILVALYGEGRTRGQIARLRIPAATNQACAALINPAMPEVTNRFVFTALLAAYDDLRGESAGGNQPNLSNGLVRRWVISLPPILEQQEIVRRVDTLFKLADAIEKRVAAASARAEKLTQAILAKAFRGQLVPTEADLARREGRDYEPASALLERIRTERQGKDTASKEERKPRRRASRIE